MEESKTLERLIVASNNKNKLREFDAILGHLFQVVSMRDAGIDADIEEDGVTFEDNALIKAQYVMDHTGCAAIADDSGLEVDALGGAPGVYSARYCGRHGDDEANNDLLLENLRNVPAPRTGRYVASDILTIIKGSIDYARCAGHKISCYLDRLNIKKPQTDMRVLSTEEQQKLLVVLLSDIDLPKLGVLLSLYTGMRIGEVCALRWENLDLSDALLSIRETLQRIQDVDVGSSRKTKIVITEPKSKNSIRVIPLPSSLIQIARQFQAAPKAYILTGRVDKYMEPRSLQYNFKKYIEESGLSDVNYHALRHTFATRCIELGFDVKTLSEILGHTNVNITLNRYVHSSMDTKRANMQRLQL